MYKNIWGIEEEKEARRNSCWKKDSIDEISSTVETTEERRSCTDVENWTE